jgi:ADP-ribose pyrophosphatase
VHPLVDAARSGDRIARLTAKAPSKRDDACIATLHQRLGRQLATGKRCLELPAGLVGDEDQSEGVEATALKELEQETGYTAERIERIGEFFASPGMVSEGFTLVRAHGLTKVGEGGGDHNEDINVHLVARDEIPAFIEQKRGDGLGIDVKLLLFLNS